MNYILSIILLFAPLIGHAQTAVSGAKADEMMQKVGEVAQKTKSLQCSFTQTKTLKMLSQKMVSKGRMCYSQPSKLRWQYTSPYQYTFILNGTKVLMKSAQRKDVVDAAKNKVFREITGIMLSSVTGECLTDKQRFKTQMFVDGDKWVAQLTPLKKEMKQMFSLLVITFDSKQLIATTVEMREKGGDNTRIELHQVKKMRTITLYILLLWLSVASLSAQGRRWNVELSFKKAAITGLCIIDTVEQQPRGAILNEFGIKMVDFVCMPNGKVKLYNLVPMLNKWYIRRVLRHDLQQIVPQLVTRDSLTYENPKRHITYRFKPLKPTEDETER